MNSHWFIIASQKTIKIYADISEQNRLRPIVVLKNSWERVRDRDTTGPMLPHTLEDKAIVFAKELVDYLVKEQQDHKFKTLTVVAEPHFLGKIRSVMDHKLQHAVIEWVKKDLEKTPQSQIPKHLFPKKTNVRIDSGLAKPTIET